MAKLYFYYGCVGGGKTNMLISVVKTFEIQNKKILILKPKIDTRDGILTIASRNGLKINAHGLVDKPEDISKYDLTNISCIILDECQFASSEIIETLKKITISDLQINVMCFGLRTDFQGNLFDGSKRLFEIADKIIEIKSTCNMCNNKSTMNARINNGKIVKQGDKIELGNNNYIQVCYKHFI